MPLFSENRENLRLGQFSPVIIRRKRQELAKESVGLKDRFRVLSSQQLKRLNQVIAEREAEVPNGIPPVLRNTVGFTTEIPAETPIEKPGFFRKGVSAIGGGILGAGEMYGHAVRGLPGGEKAGIGEEGVSGAILGITRGIEKRLPILKEPEDTGAIYQGIRSAVTSLTSRAPHMLAGAALGSAVAPGLGTFIGVLGGYVFGGATLFGLAEYDSFVENAVQSKQYKQGKITRDQIESGAIKSGLHEAGWEFASDILTGAITLGMGAPIAKAGITTLKEWAKTLFKTSGKEMAKRATAIMAGEVSTEMATAGFQTEEMYKLGLTDARFMDGMKQAFGPAFVASLIFAGFFEGGVRLNRRKVKNALENADVTPEARIEVVNYVQGEMAKILPELADTWGDLAMQAVENKESISMDEKMIDKTANLHTEKTFVPEREPEIEAEPTLAEKRQVGIERISSEEEEAYRKTPEGRQELIEAEMPTPMTTISEETTNLASVKPSPMRAFGMRERPVIEPAPTEPTAEVARDLVGVEIAKKTDTVYKGEAEGLYYWDVDVGEEVPTTIVTKNPDLEELQKKITDTKKAFAVEKPEKEVVAEKVKIKKTWEKLPVTKEEFTDVSTIAPKQRYLDIEKNEGIEAAGIVFELNRIGELTLDTHRTENDIVVNLESDFSALPENIQKAITDVGGKGETVELFGEVLTIPINRAGEAIKSLQKIETGKFRENITDEAYESPEDVEKAYESYAKPPIPEIEKPAKPEAVTEEIEGEAIPKPTLKELKLTRILEKGEIPSTEKPHGLYFTIGEVSPHREIGTEEIKAIAKGKNVLEVPSIKVAHVRFGELKSGEASSGISALKKLVSEKEFSRLIELNKKDLITELSEKYPKIKWNKYYDSYEVLEGYAGLLARERGYDAISQIDKTAPEFSEYIALTDKAFEKILEVEPKVEKEKVEAMPKKKPTDVEVLSETKSRLIENIKSEKGESVLINDLAQLGTDAIRRGHESFKAFSAQMKTTLSEVWDKIKHLMREAYEAAKVVLKSERGEVALRPKKLTAAEKMLGIRKPKMKDIIEIYKEKHIALKPKRLRLTKETAKDFIAKVYTKFVFKEYPAIRLALKAKDPKVVQRVQDQINRVWGKGGIVEVFVAGKGPHRLDAEGKPVYIKDMQSLKEIVKDLNPQEYEDYETLRIAERDVALARFRPDITGTDIKSSSEVIEAIERKYGEGIKKLRDISKAQRKYDDILLQLLVEEGWLSKKIYETIKARPESEFYASFVREMESVGEQVLGGKDPLKKIRGSELRKMPTIESSISNTYKTIKLLETIKLNKEIAKLKDLTPDLAEIIKEVKPHYIPVKQTLEAEIDPKMKRELDEVTKGLGATVETLKKVGRSKLGQFIHEMRGLGLTDEESNRIELKFATTEKTYAHELGHLIDRKFDLQTLLIKGKGEEYPVIKKELRKIADQRQPDQARALAPAAVKKLEAFFNSKPQLKKLLTIRPSGQATLAKMSDVLFAKSPIPPKNTIIVPVNGMKHYWEIPADVHKAINYYSPQEMSMVIKILSWPAQTLRAGATLTAEFIMRNPARDQFTAMVYSKYGYIPMWDLSKGFFELMKKGDLYQEFKAGGGEQSYFTSMDRTTLNLTARDIVGFKKGLKTYNPIEYLRIASEAMEKATRLGIFKRARSKGATVPQATAAARESTLDFRRIGEERRINQIIAFWNANVQGIDIMRRKLYKHPGRTLLRLTMGITLPSIALWLFNNSDDERKKRYNALPGWRKNFFWNIIIEDTPIISLPKPFELGLIFGSLPERILDYIALNDPKELKTIAQSIKDGAMPGLIPTAALPILENLTNWSFFMERPIESETIKRLPPGQRAHQYTSTVLKKFGKATNLSPIKLENWIRGWTGGLGKLGLDITDPLFETDEIPEVTKHWYEVTPGLRGFVAKEPIGGAGKDIANFYDNLEKITQAEQGFKLLFKTDKEEADKFNKKTKGIKGFAASFRKTSRKLGKLRKRKSVIMESKEYTSDKKRELVDEIDERMTEIARARNETLLKPKQPISGMVPWKTKRKKKPAWQKSVGFGKKPSWQTSVF
jgi:hypothetical protein